MDLYDVFISYARKDGMNHAEQLERDLTAAGLRTWRDRRDLDPDQDFSAELEHGIERSTRVVCCITPDTRRDNSFVRREIGYALAVHKPIVPLIFEDTIPPIHIINVTREDFTHVPWQHAFTSLLARLLRGEKSADQRLSPPADPFRSYLNALYSQIIDFFKNSVFTEIVLHSEETGGAVSKPVRTALPVAFWRGAIDGLTTDTIQPERFQSFSDAFSRNEGRVLLLGDPGAGKTTTLLAFARDRVAARLHDPKVPLPLLAQISTWDSINQTPLADWLASQIPMLDRSRIASQIASSNALLMLDGLDELGRERIHNQERFDPRKRFVANLPENGQVIVSCRAKDYSELGLKIGLTGAVTLKKLNDLQIREFLADMPALWQAIEADQDLRDLARTPLLLSILARAYRDNISELLALSDLRAAPGELRDNIFEAYVRSRFTHEQRRGSSEMSFSVDETYRLLGQVVIDGVEYTRAGWTEEGIDVATSISKRLGAQASSFKEQMHRLHLLMRTHETVKEQMHRLHLLMETHEPLRFIHLLLRDHFGFRYAMAFLKSPEFQHSSGFLDEEYRFRKRTLQFLAESGDERALEPLLEEAGPYLDFPLCYSLRFADPRVLLAFARSLLVDEGDPKNDYVSDAAMYQIRVVAEKLGSSASAQILSSAIRSCPVKDRASYVFALGFLELAEGFDAAVFATRDGDATVRGCAAYALAALGKTEAADALKRLFGDWHGVSSWNLAPWGSGTRVDEIAVAALTGDSSTRMKPYFPKNLRDAIASQGSKELK
jgi:hypothetical protein